MDSLDDLFDEAGVDTNVEISAPPPRSIQKEKADGQASSTQMGPKAKATSSSATKAADPKKRKRKELEKNATKTKSPTNPSGSAGVIQTNAGEGRGAGTNPDKKLKGPAGPSEEITAADFAVMAKVARIGAEAFEKMKQAALVNTPENLAGMYSESQTYNARLARKLAWVRLELRHARREYVELLKEHRELKAECDKNADLLKRLVAAEQQAAENRRKAAELEKVSADLQAARDELARVRKEAETAEAKAAEADKRCQALKKTSAEAAKLGYTRCLSQVLVLDPEFPVSRVHLTQRVENGKILARNGQVVYSPPEAEDKAAEEDEAGGQEGTPRADGETQKEDAGEN